MMKHYTVIKNYLFKIFITCQSMHDTILNRTDNLVSSQCNKNVEKRLKENYDIDNSCLCF